MSKGARNGHVALSPSSARRRAERKVRRFSAFIGAAAALLALNRIFGSRHSVFERYPAYQPKNSLEH